MENALTDPLLEPIREEAYRTVIHYSYDSLGRMIQETRIKLESQELGEEEEPKKTIYTGVDALASVEHDDVNSFLENGYVILHHYQKTCIMALYRKEDEGGE